MEPSDEMIQRDDEIQLSFNLRVAQARIAELEAERDRNNTIMAEAADKMFDCPVHGDECVPYAQEQIRDMRADVERLRCAIGEISMRVGQRKENGDEMTVTAVAIELSDLKLKEQAAAKGD